MYFILSINTTKQLYIAVNTILLLIYNVQINYTLISVIDVDNMNYIMQIYVETTVII